MIRTVILFIIINTGTSEGIVQNPFEPVRTSSNAQINNSILYSMYKVNIFSLRQELCLKMLMLYTKGFFKEHHTVASMSNVRERRF
jgi:hypothetical protein